MDESMSDGVYRPYPFPPDRKRSYAQLVDAATTVTPSLPEALIAWRRDGVGGMWDAYAETEAPRQRRTFAQVFGVRAATSPTQVVASWRRRQLAPFADLYAETVPLAELRRPVNVAALHGIAPFVPATSTGFLPMMHAGGP